MAMPGARLAAPRRRLPWTSWRICNGAGAALKLRRDIASSHAPAARLAAAVIEIRARQRPVVRGQPHDGHARNGSRLGGHGRECRRSIHIVPILMPPVLFGGLFVALWCWKCAMMVLFQNHIIYNPFLPPNSRSLQIADFARDCGGVGWHEERIRSLDGTEIALCVADVLSKRRPSRDKSGPVTPVYILYFQGNASSLPPRLPDLSWILRRLQDAGLRAKYTMVCVSYRGYWTSHDRPSERGINKDTQAALEWVARLQQERSEAQEIPKPVVVLWGQSIGCGFATNLAANTEWPDNLPLDALVLETPFLSTRAMLSALYPQKWLPYQYLYPFLWNHLDSFTNMGLIAQRHKAQPPGIFIVQAGRDELVPADHPDKLHQQCVDVGLSAERRKVARALHNEAMTRADGKDAIMQSIVSAVTNAQLSASGSAVSEPNANPTEHCGRGPGQSKVES